MAIVFNLFKTINEGLTSCFSDDEFSQGMLGYSICSKAMRTYNPELILKNNLLKI